MNNDVLEKYIDTMIHSCLKNVGSSVGMMHMVKDCSNRKEIKKEFLQRFIDGSWSPQLLSNKEVGKVEREENEGDQEISQRSRVDLLVQEGEEGIYQGRDS